MTAPRWVAAALAAGVLSLSIGPVAAHFSAPDVLTVMLTLRPGSEDSVDIAANRHREEYWPSEQERLTMLAQAVAALNVGRGPEIRLAEVVQLGVRFHEVGSTGHLSASIAAQDGQGWRAALDTAGFRSVANAHGLAGLHLQICVDRPPYEMTAEPTPDDDPDLGFFDCIGWRDPPPTVTLELVAGSQEGDGRGGRLPAVIAGASLILVVVGLLTVSRRADPRFTEKSADGL